MQKRFDWPGLSGDVERYVSTCDSCQRNKPSQQLTPGLLMPLPLPEKVGQEWTTDMLKVPRSLRGFDAIQVFVERLAKIKHFVAVRSTDGAKEAARTFVHAVVRPHGVPTRIISDRDPRFTASFYEELTRLLGSKLAMSTARHAQTDGQSEIENKTLMTALRHYCNERQDDWDEYLDMLELAFNAATQASTKHAPFELLYGTVPRLPLDVALEQREQSRNPAALDRATRMNHAVKFAREHLEAAQARQKRNADRHRRDLQLQVDDQVMLSTEGIELRGHNNKLCSPYVGPFRVVAIVNANAVQLALPPQLQALHSTFNISKLKRYRSDGGEFPQRPKRWDRPPPVAERESNGDVEFVVERIVAKRKGRRQEQYLVAWRGYPPEENTWESYDTVKDCEALERFERQQAAEDSGHSERGECDSA